ncbi:hypothetical protein IQ07DRAFT_593131 [Pyrenochaeta sp. DS3sAY3a]|nr:hypothetical protein IQ07DRAFT_593131 [Pyrenochaeta sp. DS3sAY3a]
MIPPVACAFMFCHVLALMELGRQGRILGRPMRRARKVHTITSAIRDEMTIANEEVRVYMDTTNAGVHALRRMWRCGGDILVIWCTYG